MPVLEEHLDRSAEAGPEGLLFTSDRGGPLSRHNRSWWRAAVLQAGLAEVGATEPAKRIVTGAVIVGAVILDAYRRRRTERRERD